MAASTEETHLLASASPRRTELLAAIGVRHEVFPATGPELAHGGEPAGEHARLSALDKARRVALVAPGRVVLGADTVVSVGSRPGDVLGKPADDADAARMLRLLSGRTHDVTTGLALVGAGVEAADVAITRVTFRELPDDLVQRYVASGEPRDKAGAYAIQGLLATHVERIEGSWSNVVGLPQELLPSLFARIGRSLAAFQRW